ncbi:MAG: transporter substrate-binding protein [Jaaginema sp. PMC 1078.18]|nr:transporter substrate-binding protein [Jaaginema sp. PMC 1078.18]
MPVGILAAYPSEATDRQAFLHGTYLALAQINARGGILGCAIEPILVSAEGSLEQWCCATEQLLSQKTVHTVLAAGDSQVRKALIPILEKYQCLLWYASRYEGLEHSVQIFYTGACPNQYLEPAIAWLAQQPFSKIYLLGSDTLLAKTSNHILKNKLKAIGKQIVGEDYIALDTDDFEPAIARLRTRQPHLLFNTLVTEANLAFYPQYSQSQLTIPSLAINLNEAQIAQIGDRPWDCYTLANYFPSLDNPSNHQFKQAYQNQDDNAPLEEISAAAYRQVYLWKQAVELAHTFTGDRVRVAAYGQSLDSPSGLVSLAANHHLSQPCYLAHLRPHSNLERIETLAPQVNPLPWLGTEAATFKTSDILLEVISEISHWIRRSQVLEERSEQIADLENAIAQLRNEATAYQQVETVMQDYGTELRALFSAMSDTVFVTNARGITLKIAPTNPNNPHKPDTTAIGKSLADLYPPKTAAALWSYLQQALATQQTVSFEICLSQGQSCDYNPDLPPDDEANSSTELWLAASLSAVNHNTVVWVGRDITERKYIEQARERDRQELEMQFAERTAALVVSSDQLVTEIVEHQQAVRTLQSTRDQLQAILDAVPGIVSWISSDLRYLGVNRHLAQTFGLPCENFVGKDIGFLQASSDFKDFVRDFFRSNVTETLHEITATVSDNPRSYLIAAQKYDEGRAAFTVGIDITERARANESLRATKEQLQAILDAVPGIVSWISSDLRYLGVNRHLAQTFNLPPLNFVGKDIGFLQASSDFKNFVRNFFHSPAQEDLREIATRVRGQTHHYLIAAQKYDEGRAAFTVGIDITKRFEAIEGLRQAEEKYRAIFENTVEGIFQTLPDGSIQSANPALARIYGYSSPQELMSGLLNARDLYLDPQRRAEFVRIIESSGVVVDFESQVSRRDGNIVWISENARAVRDENGDLLYYEGTVEDITERKRAEAELKQLTEQLETRVEERTQELQQLNLQLLMEIGERERIEAALRKSEAELKALFAAMTDAIAVFDAQGRYIKVVTTNSEAIYSPVADRMGKSVYEVLPLETADLFLANITKALQSGETVNIEYCLRLGSGGLQNPVNPNAIIHNAEGEEVWFAASVSPLPEDCVIWVARNITERRRVLNALQEAEEKYRSIFENAAEGIFQISLDGRYLSANPALLAMYGYNSFTEMAERLFPVKDRLFVSANQWLKLTELLATEGYVSDYQSRVYRRDLSTIWTSQNIRLVRDEENNPAYYEGTIQNITKRKLAEDALHWEREKSERLLLNILPKRIAERLKQDSSAIAERFEDVTILFADIVDFTSWSSRVAPTELVDSLNDIFSVFDQLAQKYGLEKIKTIGDAYMVAGGLPIPRPDHAEVVAKMALEMQSSISGFRRDDGEVFRLRIGINTGPVVAGVIGINKFIYDLWGDAVNVASRMESHGVPEGIQVTQQTYEYLRDKYHFEARGEIAIKGKGKMPTYWLRGHR